MTSINDIHRAKRLRETRQAIDEARAVPKRDARTLCGLPVGNGEVGELVPGSDFGASAKDCRACAEAR